MRIAVYMAVTAISPFFSIGYDDRLPWVLVICGRDMDLIAS